jgi:hypothetical protein
MNSKEMSQIVFEAANQIVDELIDMHKESSLTYPKDLGSWGLEESKIEELKRHLKKLKVELKVFDLMEQEFPTLVGKNLIELELKSSTADGRKVVDVLKRLKAFPLEHHHVTNLKRKELKNLEKEEKSDGAYQNFSHYNMGLSGMEMLSNEHTPENILMNVFEINKPEIDKIISNIKIEKSSLSDDGLTSSSITGEIKKEWLDKNYGVGFNLKKIEKELGINRDEGPGQSFFKSTLSLKPKNDESVSFEITTESGLDV